jgi:hypothetical protein
VRRTTPVRRETLHGTAPRHRRKAADLTDRPDLARDRAFYRSGGSSSLCGSHHTRDDPQDPPGGRSRATLPQRGDGWSGGPSLLGPPLCRSLPSSPASLPRSRSRRFVARARAGSRPRTVSESISTPSRPKVTAVAVLTRTPAPCASSTTRDAGSAGRRRTIVCVRAGRGDAAVRGCRVSPGSGLRRRPDVLRSRRG